MSIDLMNRVWWREDIPTTQRFVLLSLADRADDEGLCWYSIATIMRKTGLSRRGAQNAILWLEKAMLLRRMHRTDRSNFYIINVSALPYVERPERGAKETGPIDMLGHNGGPDLFGHPAHDVRPPRAAGASTRAPGATPRAPGAPIDHSDSRESPEFLARAREDGGEEEVIGPKELFEAEAVHQFVTQWQQLATDHPRVPSIANTLGDKRRGSLLARIREGLGKAKQTPEAAKAAVDSLFEHIKGSPFLCGEVKDWAVTADWVLGPVNWTKTMERRNERELASNDSPFGAGSSAVRAGERALEVLRAGRERSGARGGAAAG